MNDLLTKELMVRTQIMELLRNLVKNEKDKETIRMICNLSSKIHKLEMGGNQ